MYAISISLGACSAFVAVTYQTGSHASTNSSASIKVVANVAGHRRTPVVAALTENEILFGDNAVQIYPRKPQKVVPYLFLYTAAAAALTDALRSHDKEKEKIARQLLQSVDEASRIKYASHCPMEEERTATHASAEKRRLGFYYEKISGEDAVEEFVSSEDLFVDFLNYVKEHVIDAACGLTAAGGGGPARGIALTLSVPRCAFPGAACAANRPGREGPVAWLREAVSASLLGGACEHVSIIFSDEACLLAVDGVLTESNSPYFLCSPGSTVLPLVGSSPTPAPIPFANLLVIDWGAHALAFSVLRTVKGLLVLKNNECEWVPPYLCSTPLSNRTVEDTSSYFAVHRSCGGDALDAVLADCVASQYILKNYRVFSRQLSGGNNQALVQRLSSFLDFQCDQRKAAAIVSECIPMRSLNRLRLSIEERKVALSTNPNANSASVEVEAFYEGMDLQDSQTLSRNRFESAIASSNSLSGMFTDMLNEFTERFMKQLTNYPINYVVIAGGMHNIPTVVQIVQKAISQSNSASVSACFDLSSLQFLNDIVAGKGFGADELAAVGACLHSSQIALLALEQAEVRSKLHKRNKKNKKRKGLSTIALQETEESLLRIWSSLSMESGGDSDDDDDDNDDEHIHVRVLKQNVYAFVGENASLRLADLTSQGTDTLELAASELSCLFSQGTPLPSRVVISHEASAGPLILYLFSDVSEELKSGDSHPTKLRVRPVYPKGVVIPLLEKQMSIVLTLRCIHDEEGDERVSLMVATTCQSLDEASALLTPHNTNECVDILLY